MYNGLKEFYKVLNNYIFISISNLDKGHYAPGTQFKKANLKVGTIGDNYGDNSSKNLGNLIACIKKTKNKLKYCAKELKVLDEYCAPNGYRTFADLVDAIIKLRIIVVGQNNHELTNSNLMV